MSYRGTGRALVNTDHPESFAVCDRCGAWRNHSDLTFQFSYRGNAMVNARLLVCKEVERCYDRPFQFNRPIIIPPDPYPTKDPRTEPFTYDENPNNPPVTVEQIIQAADDDSGDA